MNLRESTHQDVQTANRFSVISVRDAYFRLSMYYKLYATSVYLPRGQGAYMSVVFDDEFEFRATSAKNRF